MTYTYSKAEYVTALKTTLIGDTESLKQVSEYLATASRRPGFLIAMMQIVDDNTLQLDIKQAALIQLKNKLKLCWNSEREQILTQQKNLIKNTILLAVIRCHNNYKLIKLYKQIFTIIITHEYKTWLPVTQILQRINHNQDIVPLIHLLIAIATSFEFSISEQERLYFFEFLKTVLPVLLQLVTRKQQPEIVYLCIKFLWKSVHYEINNDTKVLACGWMPLVLAIISATNPLYDSNPQDIQQKQTEQFQYFHSKKWATRIFLRFIQRHAKRVSYNKKQDNRPFSDQWYNNFGSPMIVALVNQFKIKTTNKVRYFQLKCLHTLIGQKPDIMKQYGQAFQYDILLHYIKLQPDDEQLAQKDPIQFLSKQAEPSFSFNNIKRVATDAWIGFSEIGSKINKKSKENEISQSGKQFYKSMAYLQTKLQENNNPIQKQMAMYLICQLRSPITRCKQVKKMLPSLIAKYVIPEFKNQIMFLRARAVDIFTQYGSMDLDQTTIKQAVQGVYLCLTKDVYPLVRIKAATAFNCILKHQSAKDLVRPLLQDILTVYLQLLQNYDLQNIVVSLESIVEHFANQMGPFALELIKHLARLYYKLFNKDVARSEQDEYDGEAELAAAGCLKTITRIIESSMPQEAVGQLQPQIVSILDFIFLAEGNDYVQDGLVLLNSYLFKMNKITSNLSFYYQAIIYLMVGIPKEMWSTIDSLPFSETHRTILKNIKGGNNIEYIEQSTLVLRNYIQICANSAEPTPQALKNNMINLLFYLCSEIYKKQRDQYQEGEMDITYITCCTALLINLLQNHQKTLPEHLYANIWQIAKINIQKTKLKILKTLNSQLLSLLIWLSPTQILTLAHRDNLLTNFLRQLIGYQSKYVQEYQRARTILGLNTLLALPQKPQQIMNMIPDIFKTTLKLVKKNADQRIKQTKENQSEDSEDSEDIDLDNYSFGSDDQDFWEQNYDDNYSSALDEVDQIAEFKKTIEKLAIQQPSFYSELIQTVSSQDLAQMQQTIKSALRKVQALAQS